MARHAEDILVKDIYVEDDRLPLVSRHVDKLAASIEEIGLLEPIIVCRRANKLPLIVLVAGHHRLEACRKLGRETITAIVEEEDSPEIDRWRELAEIDENLLRRELTAAQRAKMIARRKKVYEETHPETKHGGDRRSSSGQAGHLNKADRFTADTARKNRKSERSIRRDAMRGEALGDDLDKIAGTSLDHGTELDALAKMTPEQRAPIVERAAAGEEISAVEQVEVDEPRRGSTALERAWSSFRAARVMASPAGRRAFYDEYREEIDNLAADLK
jgi:ParB family chromosome partitioning protein